MYCPWTMPSCPFSFSFYHSAAMEMYCPWTMPSCPLSFSFYHSAAMEMYCSWNIPSCTLSFTCCRGSICSYGNVVSVKYAIFHVIFLLPVVCLQLWKCTVRELCHLVHSLSLILQLWKCTVREICHLVRYHYLAARLMICSYGNVLSVKYAILYVIILLQL